MDLIHALKAFRALNRSRVERLSALLPPTAQFFIEALPLLFQTNDEVLPGFVSHETPVGIVNYQPNDVAIDAAKKIHHSFQYKRHSLRHYSIRGLYLINDNGLLNITPKSEFELWLIYTHPLSGDDLRRLEQKITAICDWANATLNLKFKHRLFNERTLSENTISPFDLDRVYRSGLGLAGCIPSWWTSPPEKNDDQTIEPKNHQTHNQDLIEFGTLPLDIDTSELLRLVLKHLEIAIDSDLTTCLDLIYHHTLLKQYPSPSWVSPELKRAIYNGMTDALSLDINYLKLQFITANNDNEESISLAQQSFYALSKERLTQKVTHALYPWRRRFIEQEYEVWSWPKETISQLDQRAQSHYRQALTECQLVSHQIADTMQTVFSFAQQHNINIEAERRNLEQKYKALFESDIDTINRIAPAFIPRSPEESVYLSRSGEKEGWQIDDRSTDISKTPLYQHSSLVNVVAWAVNNQLLSKSTRLRMVDHTEKVTIRVALDLVQQLLRSPLSLAPECSEQTQLSTSAEITQILLFANVEHHPVNSLSQLGLELSSLQADPLNYANSKQSLVASIEGLICTSKGQWHYVLHTGTTALLDMISSVIQWEPKQESTLKTTCWCPSENHGKKISNRIESVYHDVIKHYIHHPKSGDYLIAIADQLYQLQWQQGLCDILPLTKNKSLIQHLAQDRTVFSATNIDPLIDKDGLIRTLLNHQTEGSISLFFTSGKSITLYIVDDLGNVYKQQMSGLTETTLINHYQQFLSKINIGNEIGTIHLFRLFDAGRQFGWKITKLDTPAMTYADQVTSLPVKIELDSLQEDAQCVIHCGPKIFNGSINNPSLFKQVSDLVLGLRKSTTRYPLYITQISFIKPQNYTSRHYITLKEQLEILLNKA